MCTPFERAAVERGIAHYALYGWDLVYGGFGTVGFWNHDRGSGIGVYYRATVKDPEGELIGEVSTLGTKFQAPVRLDDVPADIFQKIAKYTKVPPL